jgi:hypothetical protein
MPRGYGSGYRIRPRPIYDENEPTWGESFGRGVGRLLQERAQKKQQTDEFENQVRDAGGEVVAPPSTMDRVRGIAGTIRRHLPGYDPLPDAEANMAKHPMQIGTTPSGDSPPLSGGAHGHRGVVDEPDVSRHYGIADEIDRAVQKGPGGYEAIMPTALGRQQMATRQQIAAEARARTGKREEFSFEKGIEHKNKLEEIAATPRTAQEDWYNRENVRFEHQKELKGTPSAGTGDKTLAERRQRVSELHATIQAAQAVIPRNAMDRRIAIRDPQQKSRIEQAEHDLDEAQKELQTYTLPEDNKGGGAPPASGYSDAERQKNAGAPIEVARQRATVVKADALQKFPKASPAAIAAYVRTVMKREGWNVE